jgi:RNA polymerase sigma-70 factor (ECF subfamily)
MTSQREVSEDLVQTVFYRMLKYRHTFTGEGEFRSWMYHLARNVLADHVQKANRLGHSCDVADFADKVGGGVAADEQLQKQQELDLLNCALATLSNEHREVLILSRFQELTYNEIAKVLATTEGAVKVRVHRAMNALTTSYLRIENGSKAHEL